MPYRWEKNWDSHDNTINKHLFDQKYSKNSKIIEYYYNLKLLFSILVYLKKCNLFLAKLNF